MRGKVEKEKIDPSGSVLQMGFKKGENRSQFNVTKRKKERRH